MIKEFDEVRQWAKIRDVDRLNSPEVNYQRFLQEAVEIHSAMINYDEEEFRDAIGDTIVTLINLADSMGHYAEDCLEDAFSVIKYRKGLTINGKGFVRYAKLTENDKMICDKWQGNAGSEYYDPNTLNLKFKV